MSGGRVLEGAIRAQVATRVEWRARTDFAEVKAAEFEAIFTVRKAHTQKEIAQALAREREIWQRDRGILIVGMDRERS